MMENLSTPQKNDFIRSAGCQAVADFETRARESMLSDGIKNVPDNIKIDGQIQRKIASEQELLSKDDQLVVENVNSMLKKYDISEEDLLDLQREKEFELQYDIFMSKLDETKYCGDSFYG